MGRYKNWQVESLDIDSSLTQGRRLHARRNCSKKKSSGGSKTPPSNKEALLGLDKPMCVFFYLVSCYMRPEGPWQGVRRCLCRAVAFNT